MKINKKTTERVAFAFAESDGLGADTLGNKGLSLVELALLKLPVPAGYTVGTMVARAYAQHGKVPKRLPWHLRQQVQALEKKTGRGFGSPANPLTVSVRSSAAISMPGMMDTVLNVGLNWEIVETMAANGEARFTYDCYRRFLAGFGEVVLGVDRSCFAVAAGRVARMSASKLRGLCVKYHALILEHSGREVPSDVWTQLEMAVEGVLRSWNSERAVTYRKVKRIDNALGTAVVVQAMVFGNRDDRSCTGVVFSRNVVDGTPGLFGEYKVRSQGEEVVSGAVTPEDVAGLAAWDLSVYAELAAAVELLERRRGKPVEVEFTVETGVLYILQVRNAVLTPRAAALVAVRAVWDKRLTKEEALACVTASQLYGMRGLSLDRAELQRAMESDLVATGKAASPGAAVGKAVLSSADAEAASKRGEKVILVVEDTTPHDLAGMLAAEGIVTMAGGVSSHAAVVARELGKPAVVGCNFFKVEAGTTLSMDGGEGVVVRGEVPALYLDGRKEVDIFLKWAAEAEAARWRAPTINFAQLHERVSVAAMIADFYMADGMYNAARSGDMAEECADLRRDVHMRVAERLALYLMVACAGELRHSSGPASVRCRVEMLELSSVYGVVYDGSHAARKMVQHEVVARLSGMDREAHTRFFELAERIFRRGAWSGSLGGQRWADIALAGYKFCSGEYSHSIFADHAFDLQHNGGTVFGKHPMIGTASVYALLSSKKYAKSVSHLYNDMGGAEVVAKDVEALFRKGVRGEVWPITEETSESIAQRAVASTLAMLDKAHFKMGGKYHTKLIESYPPKKVQPVIFNDDPLLTDEFFGEKLIAPDSIWKGKKIADLAWSPSPELDALSKEAKALEEGSLHSNKFNKYMIYLTDGEPGVGKNKLSAQPELLAKIKEMAVSDVVFGYGPAGAPKEIHSKIT